MWVTQTSASDTSNFDTEFTSEAPSDSVTDESKLSDAVQQQFVGFTYQPTEAIAGSMVSGSLMGPNALAAVHEAPTHVRPAGGIRR